MIHCYESGDIAVIGPSFVSKPKKMGHNKNKCTFSSDYYIRYNKDTHKM